MSAKAGYYRHPTLHGDAVVFVCEDDLWTVSADGGVARRLTANPGRVTFPVFSPDGASIAFTGQDDGPNEVYVMPAGGGTPRRLTWLGAITQVVGWTPRGKSVVFASDWRQFQAGFVHLHEVSLDGRPPKALEVGPARAIAYAPDGKGVVIGRNAGDPARWKRYRGGTAGTLWIDRGGTGEFEPLIRLAGNLAGPMWIGTRIYFLSDHEGHGNLYSCTPAGKGIRRHTNHEDFYVRFPSTDGRRIVYHAGADLYVFDPETDEARKIEITLSSPRAERSRKFVSPATHLEAFDLHPKGHSVAWISRGGAFSMGLWDGAARRHGAVSSERHRLAAWTADGAAVLSVVDAGGEEALAVQPAGGRGRVTSIRGDFGRVLDLAVAPAGKARVALTNHRQELLLVDLSTKRAKKVDHSAYDRIHGVAWSPDGRYLAYGFSSTLTTSHIKVLDTTTGRVRDVTRPAFRDALPAFDVEGKYLYFLSWRTFDPVYDEVYFDLGFPRASKPYLVPLRRDEASPFDAAQREPRGPEGGEDGAEAARGKPASKGKDAKGPPAVVIDFAGIEDRVVAFPVKEGRFVAVQAAKGRALFGSVPVEGSLGSSWADAGVPTAKVRLAAWTFEKEKEEVVCGGVTSFTVTPDGKTLGLRVGNRLRVLGAGVQESDLPKGGEAGRATGWLDLDRAALEVVPGLEWRQMFDEAWRLQRDHFWTPDMGGVDWKNVRDTYRPLVDRAATRAEFSDLLWELQGELGTSHCYELGGDYRRVPAWNQGFLGADLEYRPKTKAWHVVRIPRGDSWDANQHSPLAAPGVGVREGEAITAVAGVPVGADRSPYECLVDRPGRAVPLSVRDGAGRTREVVVTTLASEVPLRYRDWVEANRARVHAATKGRVGYVHVPDMGPRGFSEFHRAYLAEVEREGLIVDVRFNGGGHVSQLLLQKLLRKRIGYDDSRWGSPMSYPMHAPMGPMVALTNEYAGSDGDMFSHSFKVYGLGPLIGKRTWGGVVGIWPRHALVDGTITTQPEFSTWFFDVGFGVENYGTDPDVEVEIRPQDYAAGKDPQLARAIAEVEAIRKRQKPRRPDFSKRPDLRPPRLA